MQEARRQAHVIALGNDTEYGVEQVSRRMAVMQQLGIRNIPCIAKRVAFVFLAADSDDEVEYVLLRKNGVGRSVLHILHLAGKDIVTACIAVVCGVLPVVASAVGPPAALSRDRVLGNGVPFPLADDFHFQGVRCCPVHLAPPCLERDAVPLCEGLQEAVPLLVGVRVPIVVVYFGTAEHYGVGVWKGHNHRILVSSAKVLEPCV